MASGFEVVGEGFAGPSNPLRVGVETAVSNITKAVNDAFDDGGFSRGDIAAATLGLAGVRRQDIRERVKASFVEKLKIKKTLVITDAEIAWFGTTLGSTTGGFLSRHSWGMAIDMNTVQNPEGSPPTMNCDVVRIFRKWGQASTFLGIVRAIDAHNALYEAIRAFNITNPEHQKRLVVERRE